MSNLNQNNQNKKDIKGTANIVAEELRGLGIEKQRLELRAKRKRFLCDHKDDFGRGKLDPMKDGDYKCGKCGTIVDIELQTMDQVDRKIAEVLNIAECIKLMGSPSMVETISKIEEGIDSLSQMYEKVILKGAKNKNRNNNNNNNNNQRRASYKISKL